MGEKSNFQSHIYLDGGEMDFVPCGGGEIVDGAGKWKEMCEWKDKTLLSFFPFGKIQFVLMGMPSKGTEFIEEKRSVAAINNEKTKLPKYGSFAGFRFVEEKEFKWQIVKSSATGR